MTELTGFEGTSFCRSRRTRCGCGCGCGGGCGSGLCIIGNVCNLVYLNNSKSLAY